MAGIVAIANQKGGVGKTTTVHALGASLAQRGHRVLLVDLDPQACLTYSLGLDPEALDASLHDVIGGRVPADRAAVQVGALRVLPASIELAATEVTLLNRTGREYALARALEPLRDSFDVALLDCPPSLGILTINGLTQSQRLWKEDNYLNPCRPQGGTWKYDRAGWGPGDIVRPWEFLVGFTPETRPETLSISYALDPYVNTDRGKTWAPFHLTHSMVVLYEAVK